ncbi:MAG: putative toxin-antitoxin system toxin component, PIN family [Azonexus sp.]|nr:putative toxin-antitoxin system toxin component, PIN family [Azonexus sp.]
MLRLVLDTNVVLDLLHWADADAAPIMAALTARRAECLADERTLGELRRVLTYPRLRLTAAAMADYDARYTALAHLVPPGAAPALPRCRDRDDQMFLELAARAGADLLVSKDKALLQLRGRGQLGFRIVSPLAFRGQKTEDR